MIEFHCKLGGNVLPEPAAAMVHMLSLVMYALCSPSSLTNKWDKLPIARSIFSKMGITVATNLSMKVWNPCATLLLCAVGNDHQGVEPLS